MIADTNITKMQRSRTGKCQGGTGQPVSGAVRDEAFDHHIRAGRSIDQDEDAGSVPEEVAAGDCDGKGDRGAAVVTLVVADHLAAWAGSCDRLAHARAGDRKRARRSAAAVGQESRKAGGGGRCRSSSNSEGEKRGLDHV